MNVEKHQESSQEKKDNIFGVAGWGPALRSGHNQPADKRKGDVSVMISTRLSDLKIAVLLVVGALAGTLAIQSAPAPLVAIERIGGNVLLSWTNDDSGFVLQGARPLQSGLWQTVVATPQLLGSRLGVTLPLQTNDSQLFRLKARGVEFTNHVPELCWRRNGTFDASTLLSWESIQNPFKLNWTITPNVVGATVSPSGVVSLGTQIAPFTITASATNRVSQDSFTFHATRLEFTNSASTLSWQPNGTFNARALLALDGVTNTALSWSISGSPTATISTSGVVTLGSGGGSYAIQATASGTNACSDQTVLNAVEVRVVSIGFVSAGAGNGGNNQHVLYENADPQDWGDGAAIINPVWIAGGPGAGTPPVRNAPVCYTRSEAAASRVRVQVVANIQPAGLALNFIGLERTSEYFRTNGILSTGTDQTIEMLASVALPATIEKITNVFSWQAVFPDGGAGLLVNSGQSTQTIYTVFAAPITYVEGQANTPTPSRLDFCIVGAANGLSNKVDICHQMAVKVREMTGSTFGGMTQSPRWKFYAEPVPRELDCHHRAALAASAFGVLGIQGYVNRIYSTCAPVPVAPLYFVPNSTVNDYMGTYTTSRFKYRQPGADIHKLMFAGNNFEGCVRIEDGSADDGNVWWTIWPLERYDNAKDMLIGFSSQVPELWETLNEIFVAYETLPVDQLAIKPKIIGGPN